MKALSVKQPYASAIADGTKTREYRTWRIAHRGPLAIVASKSPVVDTLPTGCLVCVVDLVAIEGSAGQYAWVVANPRPVEATPVRGFAALYTVPDDVIVYTARPKASAKPSPKASAKASPKASADSDEAWERMDPLVARILARREIGEPIRPKKRRR